MKRMLSRLVVTLLLVIGVATLTLRSTPVGGELLNYAAIGVWYKPRQLWSAKTACDENFGPCFPQPASLVGGGSVALRASASASQPSLNASGGTLER